MKHFEAEPRNIEELIERLPDSFPLASEIITEELPPLLIDAEEGVMDHYITLIKKHTNAASKRSVKMLIQGAIERIKENHEESLEENQEEEHENDDPEIMERVDEIARDPRVFKKRIDLIAKLGVEGERKTTALYSLIIDSAKLPMGQGGSEALAGKNSGPQGSGKSHPLFIVLKLYSQSDYHLISSGSAKSLYNMENELEHKALILTEALILEGKNGDNELAYCVRTLVSEGVLKYQYTGFEDRKKVTKIQRMAGPIALVTTTIRGRLEEQLEDRLITLHPNISVKQTRNIISLTANIASGNAQSVDEKELKAWRKFHSFLAPVEVVIPFAGELSEYITRQQSLPISARRAFKRVISALKTVALVYQHQRKKDECGRVIAEVSDYAIVYQLMQGPLKESLGQGKVYTDKRIELIASAGVISARKLAEKSCVTVGAISQLPPVF